MMVAYTENGSFNLLIFGDSENIVYSPTIRAISTAFHIIQMEGMK